MRIMPPATTVNQEQIQTLSIRQEISIAAPIEVAWEAVLDQMGPESEMEDGTRLPFKREAWRGGRLSRDMGTRTGHLRGHVQVLNPPREKENTRQRDDLARQRRQLPWVRVEENSAFDAPQGKVTLADLFRGKSQLIVYHFLFGPDWAEGCPSCSFVSDHLNGAVPHL